MEASKENKKKRTRKHQQLTIALDCSLMVRKTGVQSQVELYQRLKKLYLMPPSLALSIMRYGSRVKWSNPVHLGVVAIEKGAFGSPLTKVTNFLHTHIVAINCVYAWRESRRRRVRMRESRDACVASVLRVVVFFLISGRRREKGKTGETARKDFMVPLGCDSCRIEDASCTGLNVSSRLPYIILVCPFKFIE